TSIPFVVNRQRRRPCARAGALALALVALVAVGCGTSGPKVQQATSLTTFVGQVEGAHAYVGVITDGDRVSGFVTDGKIYGKWFATIGLSDDKANLVARDGSQLGDVTISGDRASGNVIVGLHSYPFEATKTAVGGEAGLFSAAKRTANNDSFEAGWISLPDGSELGTYDTFIKGEFETHRGPPLKPIVRIPGFGAIAP